MMSLAHPFSSLETLKLVWNSKLERLNSHLYLFFILRKQIRLAHISYVVSTFRVQVLCLHCLNQATFGKKKFFFLERRTQMSRIFFLGNHEQLKMIREDRKRWSRDREGAARE